MCIRRYDVLGEKYYLMVSAATEHAVLDSVLLVRKSDYAEIDLLTEDATGFLPAE